MRYIEHHVLIAELRQHLVRRVEGQLFDAQCDAALQVRMIAAQVRYPKSSMNLGSSLRRRDLAW